MLPGRPNKWLQNAVCWVIQFGGLCHHQDQAYMLCSVPLTGYGVYIYMVILYLKLRLFKERTFEFS